MATFYTLIRDDMLMAEAARCPADLRLHSGDLTVNPAGVVARLRGPLAKYSRHFDWPLVSAGLATLRSLMADLSHGENHTFDLVCERFRLPKQLAAPIADKAIGKLEWYIGPDQEEVLYHESDLIEDAQRIVEWGDAIAARCPNERIAHQMKSLSSLSRQQLLRYVSNSLG
jgi:hypothetical protein